MTAHSHYIPVNNRTKMVTVTVRTTGKPVIQLDFPDKHPDQVTVGELKKGIQAKFPQLHIHRQRLTIRPADANTQLGKPEKPTVLSEDTWSLGRYNIPASGAEIRCKDLGPQISWRLVFLAEYAGPLFIHPALFYAATKYGIGLPWVLQKLGLPELGLGAAMPFQPSTMQKVIFGMIMAHFLKREYETIFVHRFSNATMPYTNIFKNCGHYWLLSGLLVGLTLYRPVNSASALKGTPYDSVHRILGWSFLWLFGEVSNYITHLNLRSIRTPRGQPRKFPRGYGFNLVTTANYYFEEVAWVALCGMSHDPALIVFTVLATLQMAQWADKKHRTYKKEHGDKYPRNRKRMIPYVW